MSVNGKPYSCNYLLRADLMKGASIRFEMGAAPNRQRGTAEADAPYSFADEK